MRARARLLPRPPRDHDLVSPLRVELDSPRSAARVVDRAAPISRSNQLSCGYGGRFPHEHRRGRTANKGASRRGQHGPAARRRPRWSPHGAVQPAFSCRPSMTSGPPSRFETAKFAAALAPIGQSGKWTRNAGEPLPGKVLPSSSSESRQHGSCCGVRRGGGARSRQPAAAAPTGGALCCNRVLSKELSCREGIKGGRLMHPAGDEQDALVDSSTAAVGRRLLSWPTHASPHEPLVAVDSSAAVGLQSPPLLVQTPFSSRVAWP